MCQRNDLAGAARGQNSRSKHTPKIKSKTQVKQTQAKCGAFFAGLRGFSGRGKTPLFCHSERSEESLFDVSQTHREILRRKARLRMTRKCSFRSLFCRVPKVLSQEIKNRRAKADVWIRHCEFDAVRRTAAVRCGVAAT